MPTYSEELAVRPFDSPDQYRAVINYFHSASTSFLESMGVEIGKLTPPDAWLRTLMEEHDKPDTHKNRFYLAWIYQGKQVGHSNLNPLVYGEEASIHLHLWDPELRKLGLGTQFFKRSANLFLGRFALKRIVCEPFADNDGPNKTLLRLGFKFIKKYETVPGLINRRQLVNRYELDRRLP